MICIIDESSPHNWAASNFAEHWLSFATSGTTAEYINNELGRGLGLGAILASSLKESGAARGSVGWASRRWNVNRPDGWVSETGPLSWGSLDKRSETPANRSRLGGNEISSLERAFFCSCWALTVHQSHIWGFPPIAPLCWRSDPLPLTLLGFVENGDVEATSEQRMLRCNVGFKARHRLSCWGKRPGDLIKIL